MTHHEPRTDQFAALILRGELSATAYLAVLGDVVSGQVDRYRWLHAVEARLEAGGVTLRWLLAAAIGTLLYCVTVFVP